MKICQYLRELVKLNEEYARAFAYVRASVSVFFFVDTNVLVPMYFNAF